MVEGMTGMVREGGGDGRRGKGKRGELLTLLSLQEADLSARSGGAEQEGSQLKEKGEDRRAEPRFDPLLGSARRVETRKTSSTTPFRYDEVNR